MQINGDWRKVVLQNAYNTYTQVTKKPIESIVPEMPFLKNLGGFLCSALFLDKRLTLLNPCAAINVAKSSPQTTLQALYVSKHAKAALCAEICKVFRRAVWVDNTRNIELVYRAADSTDLPTPEDRLEPEVMEKYRTIETEGDGIRSYSAICATILLDQRPLCLIDEPEMCLHPPQAYAMGRFIGTNVSDRTCTVVATHSSHVLRGILETNPKACVIRLSRRDQTFHAQSLLPDELVKTTSKPRSRSEAILEGLLSHAVVLCEGEGDRIVYESTFRTLRDRQIDIRFTASEGTGGFSDALRLYCILKVPVAVIADIDFLDKEAELRKVLEELGSPTPQVDALCLRSRAILTEVKMHISAPDTAGVLSERKAISEIPIVENTEQHLRGKLSRIVEQLYRLRELKLLGVECIPLTYKFGQQNVPLRDELQSLLLTLASNGLFLVPKGELESWLPILMKGQSKEDKAKWAMFAAEKIEDVEERHDDIWLFIRNVYDYLLKQC